MSFIQSVIEFFQSIFQASSPEVKKRQEKRKLENDLKIIAPGFYKDGMVQPNFAEVLRVLSINTKPINDLLSSTMCTEDIGRNRRFEEQMDNYYSDTHSRRLQWVGRSFAMSLAVGVMPTVRERMSRRLSSMACFTPSESAMACRA